MNFSIFVAWWPAAEILMKSESYKQSKNLSGGIRNDSEQFRANSFLMFVCLKSDLLLDFWSNSKEKQPINS